MYSKSPLDFQASQDSDQTLAHYLMWSAPVPQFQTPKPKEKNSSLTIACLGSDKLYQSLRQEASILLLTQGNWKETLAYTAPSFLLVESCLITATRDWYQAQIHQGEGFDELVRMVSFAKDLGIPTVFWNTQDVLYHTLFKQISQHFDHVFCADARVKKALQKEDIFADLLLPAVQPAIFNPFKDYAFANSFEIPILFDGWADIFRLSNNIDLLAPLIGSGLSIIESKYRLFRNKVNDTPQFLDSLLGCVTQADRQMALKYSKLNVMTNDSIATPTSQLWMSLEHSACRVPVLHHGGLEKGDIRKEIVIEVRDKHDLAKRAEHLLQDDIAREKEAQKAWRTVYSCHTFSNRLGTICERLGLDPHIKATPSVSIIIPTFRPNLIKKCIEQFDRQTYPDKELILILNTNSMTQEEAAKEIGPRKDIRHFVIPSDLVEGGCTNVGIMAADGIHSIKMDDDDLYSRHFVGDMILWNKAIDADVYGKTNCYFHFQDDDTTYARDKNTSPPLTVIPLEKMPLAHISGNSLSGKTKYFKKFPYSDNNMASTDTCYHNNLRDQKGTFVLLDKLGTLVEREADAADHSWRVSSEMLKKNMTFVSNGIPEGLVK